MATISPQHFMVWTVSTVLTLWPSPKIMKHPQKYKNVQWFSNSSKHFPTQKLIIFPTCFPMFSQCFLNVSQVFPDFSTVFPVLQLFFHGFSAGFHPGLHRGTWPSPYARLWRVGPSVGDFASRHHTKWRLIAGKIIGNHGKTLLK